MNVSTRARRDCDSLPRQMTKGAGCFLSERARLFCAFTSSVLFVNMKLMQHAMNNRRQDDSHYADEDQTTEERIH